MAVFHVVSGVTPVGEFEDEVICGDYCDLCGDCVRCFGEDPCVGSEGGGHHLVLYIEEIQCWHKEHRDKWSEISKKPLPSNNASGIS